MEDQDGTPRWRSSSRWRFKKIVQVGNGNPQGRSKIEIREEGFKINIPRWTLARSQKIGKYGTFGGPKVLLVGRCDLGGSENPQNLIVSNTDENSFIA